MPEYPDITVYVEALQKRLKGQRLLSVRLQSPFLLRTALPPLDGFPGKEVSDVKRAGKRILFRFGTDTEMPPLWMVFHLMIAGRFHWNEPGKKPPGKKALASLTFDAGLLYLTEAGTKKRASLHLMEGEDVPARVNPGGIDVFAADAASFRAALTEENHTLKRSLTDPRIFDGIGNSYSDEILHRAGLSPFTMSGKISPEDSERLHKACREILTEWTDRLREEAGEKFPEKVTAFRKEMAVHGKYDQPCPVCGTLIQRISYAERETNYCPVCQTGGKILADRALSQLLKSDWPRTIEELMEFKKPKQR